MVMAVKRKLDLTSSDKKKAKISKKEGPQIILVEEVKLLGDEVILSNKYNNLVTLMSSFSLSVSKLKSNCNEENERVCRQISLTIAQCFHKLGQESMLVGRKSHSEKLSLVVKWLQVRYEDYKSNLLALLREPFDKAASLQLDALDTYMTLIKLEAKNFTPKIDEPYFPTLTYERLVKTLLRSHNDVILADGTSNNFLILEFVERFFKYWDLQFYFFKNLGDTLKEWKEKMTDDELTSISANYLLILKAGTKVSDDVDELKEVETWSRNELQLPSIAYKGSTFKSNYQTCLLTVLAYPFTQSQLKTILLILHKRIIPNMIKPEALMDFLSYSYNSDHDEVTPVLTLHSLYYLMKSYNLEYPQFYTKLYSLLTPNLLSTRHRSRFFRLCDLFLSSTHLSANLVASFIKRLSRLSLTSLAPAIVIVIPFVYNLLKRHPSCMVLLQNVADKSKPYRDPFNNYIDDPLKTGALGSSLWELETLMSHYHPNIATLAKIFGEPFRKYSYNMEDFLDWSYISLLESEKSRNYKTSVALEFDEFKNLFGSSEQADTFIQGWSF